MCRPQRIWKHRTELSLGEIPVQRGFCPALAGCCRSSGWTSAQPGARKFSASTCPLQWVNNAGFYSDSFPARSWRLVCFFHRLGTVETTGRHQHANHWIGFSAYFHGRNWSRRRTHKSPALMLTSLDFLLPCLSLDSSPSLSRHA